MMNVVKTQRFLRLRLFLLTLFFLVWCLIKPKEILEMYGLADEAMNNKKLKERIDGRCRQESRR